MQRRRKTADKKKQAAGQRSSTRKKGDRDLEQRKKTKDTFFCCSSREKMRNASGHQCKVKMSRSEKKVNENTYDISSIKRVTKKVSRSFTLQSFKTTVKKCTKKCAARAKLLFLLIRPIGPLLLFSPFSGVAFAAQHYTILSFV